MEQNLSFEFYCYLYDWMTNDPGCDHSDQAAPAMLSVVAGSDWRSETGEWRVESGEWRVEYILPTAYLSRTEPYVLRI